MTAPPPAQDVPVEEALRIWLRVAAAQGCPQLLPAVRVGLAEAVGRVTAEPVRATRSSPPFDACAMDGIAVTAPPTPSPAAADGTRLLEPDEFDVVDTGDPLPDGRDAVVRREQVSYRRQEDGAPALVPTAVTPYQHVRAIGEDVVAGEQLLPPGHRLRAVDVAAAAAAGATDLLVRRTPVVAVLATGDEVRPIGSSTGPGQILDTNSLMLAAQARDLGCRTLVLPIEPDDRDRIAAAVSAAAPQADLVVVIAGASAGRDDHTFSVIAGLGTVAVHGVAVRPGHPVVLGVVGSTPVLGCPGYPVSAALTFDLFAAALLAGLEGTEAARRPVATARLVRAVDSLDRVQDWVRVRLVEVAGRLLLTPLTRRAGALTSLVRADGLLEVPHGVGGYPVGTEVEVELLRGLDEIRRSLVVTGSHEPALDLAAAELRSRHPRLTLSWSATGSLGGLEALRDGWCHLAGSNLLDPGSGTYTLPYLDSLMPGRQLAVVRLGHREQGLLVPAGNPLGLLGLADLARPGIRFVNRAPGSGTRALTEYRLGLLGLDPSQVSGWSRHGRSHLAVGAAVAAGRADCGLGIRAAATVFGLGFVPVATEPYDLVVAEGLVDSALLAPLWRLLDSPSFRSRIRALGGYSTDQTGTRIR